MHNLPHGNQFSEKLEEFLTTEDGPIHLRRIGLGVARREEGKRRKKPCVIPLVFFNSL